MIRCRLHNEVFYLSNCKSKNNAQSCSLSIQNDQTVFATPNLLELVLSQMGCNIVVYHLVHDHTVAGSTCVRKLFAHMCLSASSQIWYWLKPVSKWQSPMMQSLQVQDLGIHQLPAQGLTERKWVPPLHRITWHSPNLYLLFQTLHETDWFPKVTKKLVGYLMQEFDSRSVDAFTL